MTFAWELLSGALPPEPRKILPDSLLSVSKLEAWEAHLREREERFRERERAIEDQALYLTEVAKLLEAHVEQVDRLHREYAERMRLLNCTQDARFFTGVGAFFNLREAFGNVWVGFSEDFAALRQRRGMA